MDTVTTRIVGLAILLFFVLVTFDTMRAGRKIKYHSREENESTFRKLLKRNMMAVCMFIFLLLLFTVVKGCQ